jgi:Na+/H+ antiporter NhaD/arsenite permease-like protein
MAKVSLYNIILLIFLLSFILLECKPDKKNTKKEKKAKKDKKEKKQKKQKKLLKKIILT